MLNNKFTPSRIKKLKDCFYLMECGIKSGNWLLSKASLYSTSAEFDGKVYERLYYDTIASIPSNWVSKNYLNTDDKKKYTTKDHMMKPQFGGKFLMDNPDIWLGSFEKFLEWSMRFSMVISVTKEENTRLRVDTNYIPLEETYAYAGIQLFENGGVGYGATPYDPFKDLPEIFKKYQKEYLKKKGV
jgi:hypothetical protein|tara:strand:+ start:199 stop:756 length:558 start_codon:yes stop_codon:yes gene_type:complete